MWTQLQCLLAYIRSRKNISETLISTKRTVPSLIQGDVFLNSCGVALLLQRLGSVHTMPVKFENQFIYFLRLPAYRPHYNPSRKGSFSKTLLIRPKEFENTAAFSLSCGRKTFWKRSLWKWRHGEPDDFPDRVFLKHKSKITGDFCDFKFLRTVSVNWSRSVECHARIRSVV